MISPDRFYHFTIWERDLDEPSATFVGRRIEGNDMEGVYVDQDGRWYYSYSSYCEREFLENDLVTIRSEALYKGRTFEELLSDWDEVNSPWAGEYPEILKLPQRSEIHELEGTIYDRRRTRNALGPIESGSGLTHVR
jgi:hypothetical protein